MFGTVRRHTTQSFGHREELPHFGSTSHSVSWVSHASSSPHSGGSSTSHENTACDLFQHKQLFSHTHHRQSPAVSVSPHNTVTTSSSSMSCGTETLNTGVSVGTNMELPEHPNKAIGTYTQVDVKKPRRITMDQCIQTDDLEEYIRSQNTSTTSAGTDLDIDSPPLLDKSVDNIATNMNVSKKQHITRTAVCTTGSVVSSSCATTTLTDSNSKMSKRVRRFPVGDCDDIVAGSTCPMDKQLSIEIDDPADIFHDAPVRISSPVKHGQKEVSPTQPPLLTPPVGPIPMQGHQSHNGILNIIPPNRSMHLSIGIFYLNHIYIYTRCHSTKSTVLE